MTHSSLPTSQILHGDCIDIMQTLPAESIDVIFADPPYNLQLRGDLLRPDASQVNTIDDAWDTFSDFTDYDAFTREWLTQARRLMKPRSSIWVCGSYHNIFRVGTTMQDMGFWLLNTIAWYKRDATPNFNGVRLKNDVEWLIWARRSENDRHKFNHHLMKAINGDKQHGSMWNIPKVKRYEQILDANRDRRHNTQKPEALLERVLLASSEPGDLVLDPFFGTGTTGAVAKRLRRCWIGIERNVDYVELAQKRIETVNPLPPDHDYVQPIPSRRPHGVPFLKLIQHGYLNVGR
jgi:modification methylase